MKKLSVFLFAIVFVFGVMGTANAVFIDRGVGMIYDSDQDITWLQDATTSGTIRSYEQALSWADQLVYGGYGDWRLPTSPGTTQGWINEGEVGSLYYTELGNSPDSPASSVNIGPFIMSSYYITWIDAPQLASNSAWSFQFKSANSGFQNAWNIVNSACAWGVMDGDYGPSVSESLAYETMMQLGSEISFDYFWEMGIAPPDYTGQSFDVLALQGGAGWQYIGQTAAYDSSTDWASIVLAVPEELWGMETQVRFVLSDYGPDTGPTVYLRNVASDTAPVPEPSTMLLFCAGLLGFAGFRKKFRKA